MTKEQCLSINGLDKKQAQTIKRYFWEAERKGKECKLTPCKTEAEVLEIVNASFKGAKETPMKQTINLAAMSVEELENLLTQIPEIIANKKAEKLAEVEAKIKELEELKAELSK